MNFGVMIYFVNLIRFHTMLNALDLTTYRYLKIKSGLESKPSAVVVRKSQMKNLHDFKEI